jgi:hypothetical protein
MHKFNRVTHDFYINLTDEDLSDPIFFINLPSCNGLQ